MWFRPKIGSRYDYHIARAQLKIVQRSLFLFVVDIVDGNHDVNRARTFATILQSSTNSFEPSLLGHERLLPSSPTQAQALRRAIILRSLRPWDWITQLKGTFTNTSKKAKNERRILGRF